MLQTATVDGATLVLNYGEPLNESSVPAASAYSVSVDGAAGVAPRSVAVSGNTVTLTLATAAAHGQAVTVGYTAPSSNPVQDANGNDAPNLSAREVTNNTPDTSSAPALRNATVDGASLVLNYGEPLNESSVPAASAFSVSIDGGAGATPRSVTVSGSTVILTLARSVTHGQRVMVSYTRPAANPLRDTDGNDVAGLSARAVRNDAMAPTGITVADARTLEAENAALVFEVTLSRPPAETITVEYETSDGTAQAGVDYIASAGTLTFPRGKTRRTVTVTVLSDSEQEGMETLRLTLSAPTGSNSFLADAEAIGEISDRNPLARDWLARLGRTIASMVVDAIGRRLEGYGDNRVTVGGQALDLSGNRGGPGDGEQERDASSATDRAWGSRTMTGREALLGSSFRFAAGGDRGKPEWTAWGRFAMGQFSAAENGSGAGGTVTSGFLGADVSQGRWLGGVAISSTTSTGDFSLVDDPGRARDRAVEGGLTAVYPYARVRLKEKIDLWALAGYGLGELTVGGGAVAQESDVRLRMGAVGARGEVFSSDELGGFSMTLKSDAFWVRTTSEASNRLERTDAEASRLRFVVQGSRTFSVGTATMTPSLELGLRTDAGDAETGVGAEAGAGLTYALNGMSLGASGRFVLAREPVRIQEWGVSGALRIVPGAGGRGLLLTLAPSLGSTSSGVERLWSLDSTQEVSRQRSFSPGRRLETELGYGLGIARLPGTITPYVGHSFDADRGQNWRAGARWRIAPKTTLQLEASRMKAAKRPEDAEHGIGLRFISRW